MTNAPLTDEMTTQTHFQFPRQFVGAIRALPTNEGIMVSYSLVRDPYTVYVLLVREANGSVWTVEVIVKPIFMVWLLSWLTSKPLRQDEIWKFTLDDNYLSFLPDKIEGYVRSLEWWIRGVR